MEPDFSWILSPFPFFFEDLRIEVLIALDWHARTKCALLFLLLMQASRYLSHCGALISHFLYVVYATVQPKKLLPGVKGTLRWPLYLCCLHNSARDALYQIQWKCIQLGFLHARFRSSSHWCCFSLTDRIVPVVRDSKPGFRLEQTLCARSAWYLVEFWNTFAN